MKNVLFNRTNNHFPKQPPYSSAEHKKHKIFTCFFGSRTSMLDVNIWKIGLEGYKFLNILPIEKISDENEIFKSLILLNSQARGG